MCDNDLANGIAPAPVLASWLLGLLILATSAYAVDTNESQAGESLYNGIRLPSPWPPADRPLTREPMPLPYLEAPPPVIPLDVGRQLFVDDFLIEETNLRRTYHAAQYIPDNPIVKPDQPWEQDTTSHDHPAPTAMVFSDGVWYDPQDGVFKMWYMGGYCKATCYATSKDGIHWAKPSLDVVAGTNIVHASGRDSGTVWLDLSEQDPQRRYKMFLYTQPEGAGALSIFFSADGVHWDKCAARNGPLGDRSTVFYNPFRKVWVYSIRDYERGGLGRFRRYWEHPDVLAAARWRAGEPPFWVGADLLDPPRGDLATPCELYNLDAAAYESLLIGLFSIWRGQPQDRAKPNEVCVGFSRDGFHWHRPMREAFIAVSERYGDWNWGNVQSAGGCCLVVRDSLYFYVSGRKGVAGSPASGVCSTGLATLRRDGFASMDAREAGGTLTTRPVRFQGKHLFVNCNTAQGELRVEVLGPDWQPVAPFSYENCSPIRADKTLEQVRWETSSDLSALAGKPVRFRFHLRNGRLYAFWISPDPSGASNGYVAGGGPGFTGLTDTVGLEGYRD